MGWASDVGLLLRNRGGTKDTDDEALQALKGHLVELEDVVSECVTLDNKKEAEMWLVDRISKVHIEGSLQTDIFHKVMHSEGALDPNVVSSVLECMCEHGKELLGRVLCHNSEWESVFDDDDHVRAWFPSMVFDGGHGVVAPRGSAPLRDFIFAERCELWEQVEWRSGSSGHPPVLTVNRPTLQLEIDTYKTAKRLLKQLLRSSQWAASLPAGDVLDVDRAAFVKYFASLLTSSSNDPVLVAMVRDSIKRFLRTVPWATLVAHIAATCGESVVMDICKLLPKGSLLEWDSYREVLLYNALSEKLPLVLNMIRNGDTEKLCSLLNIYSTRAASNDYVAFARLGTTRARLLLLFRSCFITGYLPVPDVAHVLRLEGFSATAVEQDPAYFVEQLSDDEDPMACFLADREKSAKKKKKSKRKTTPKKKTCKRRKALPTIGWTIEGHSGMVSCHDIVYFVASVFKERWG